MVEIILRYLIEPNDYSIEREILVLNKSSDNFIFRIFEESLYKVERVKRS